MGGDAGQFHVGAFRGARVEGGRAAASAACCLWPKGASR
ncbi:hypothetical protein A3768_3278 [Ralstonia solanacearum]|nr:hypothetical protein A3768_3278 [Ralstonia solanacearum]